MENQVFPKPQVRRELDKFIMVKLYTDDPDVGDAHTKLQLERFGSNDLPLYVILTPEGKEVARSVTEFDADKFAVFLKDGFKKSGVEID